MDRKQTALERYEKAVEAQKNHIRANQSIFSTHEQLAYQIIDAENYLRDVIAEEKEGVIGSDFTVIYTPQTQTYADIDVIDNLIAGGIIPQARRAEIVKTVERPAKVFIRPNKD